MRAHVEPFREWLDGAGYTPGSARGLLMLMGQLGRWMDSESLDGRLTGGDLRRFQEFLRARCAHRVPRLAGTDPLMSYLSSIGVLEQEAPLPVTPVEELIDGFRAWMIGDRGLAAGTVLRYENTARRFLNERYVDVGERFITDLTARHVTGFLIVECGRVSAGSAKGRVAELRALLRFLFLHGLTSRSLAVAIPTVAGWHGTTIPKVISPSQVNELIDSCDRSTATGVRDAAVLLLVARLGLRSAEVVGLTFDDIDWRVGEIIVRGKARRQDRLPLPHEVGEALADYLRSSRPVSSSRRVFLSAKAPIAPLPPARVNDICRRACLRVGIGRVGAHRLRHTLASDLLRKGATIIEVSQVLRHRDLATTAVYAKVDIDTLRRVAQPWPGVGL
ncbi:MAG: tyrosine-type recombinase/integrase [Acidimicrobiales bacterium]